MAELPLLLDTHVWIWVSEGDTARVRRTVIRAINDAARDGRLLVSAVSVWELALLVTRGRVRVSEPLPIWATRRARGGGHQFVPLTADDALASVLLRGTYHADPADRFLIATAQRLNARLVTADEKILAYAARDGGLRVLNPGREVPGPQESEPVE